jgi:hypothetical protein
VPERSGQEFVTAFLEMLRERAFDRLPEFLSPDCVFEYPQSGERFRGLANIRPLFENYPGGLGRSDADSLRVRGDVDRWAMAPNFTLIRMSGRGGSYTFVVKMRYADDSEWYLVNVFELEADRMTQATVLWAPLFEAPDWRKPFAESTAGA